MKLWLGQVCCGHGKLLNLMGTFSMFSVVASARYFGHLRAISAHVSQQHQERSLLGNRIDVLISTGAPLQHQARGCALQQKLVSRSWTRQGMVAEKAIRTSN